MFKLSVGVLTNGEDVLLVNYQDPARGGRLPAPRRARPGVWAGEDQQQASKSWG